MLETSFVPGNAARRFVALILRHRWILWGAAWILSVPAVMTLARLYGNLDTEVATMLPPDKDSVVALHELRDRLSGLQHLGVIVDAGTPENLDNAEKFLDELAGRIRAFPPQMVAAVRTGLDAEKLFIENNAPLLMDLEDLRSIRQRVEARYNWEIDSQMSLGLDDAPAIPPPVDFSDIEAKYKKSAGKYERFRNGRFTNTQESTSLLIVDLPDLPKKSTDVFRDLLSRVKLAVTEMGGPEKYVAGMRIGYTGDVAITVEETAALEEDLTLSTILVIAAVIAVLIFYYQVWWSVPAILAPLLIGVFFTFGVAWLLGIRTLNSNSAFLGSIVIGNGINFGIMLLARYVEERRANRERQEAMVFAVSGAFRGTISAAMAAGVAYTSLIVTSFEGFRQFGIIGGAGMLVCWGITFTLMPSLVLTLDRRFGGLDRLSPEKKPIFMRYAARSVFFMPWVWLAFSIFITGFAAWKLSGFDSSRMETDFSRLRRADTWTSGEGYWGRKMDRLMGEYLTPLAIMTDSPEQAGRVATALRARASAGPLAEMIATIRTADDIRIKDEIEKRNEIYRLQAIVYKPAVRAKLSLDQAKTVDRFLGKVNPNTLRPEDMPPTFSMGLREKDGSFGKTVLVFPKATGTMWQGQKLTTFVEALRQAARETGGNPGRVAGSLPVAYDIINSIYQDGFFASGFALAGVILVVVGVFRLRSATAFVVLSLLMGVSWMAATGMLLDIKLNFANFIAFPITFGIGVDYAVNVMSRYEGDGRADLGRVILSTGGAVGLCSLTTILGYSSLLLAQNRGLYNFGLLAVTGEITCLITAVLVLPAALLLVKRGRPKAV